LAFESNYFHFSFQQCMMSSFNWECLYFKKSYVSFWWFIISWHRQF